MHVSEVFQSIQGEGMLAGTATAFVRTTGCNLRCSWCDTPYTSWEPEGVERELDDIVEEIDSYDVEYTVLTGGEPLLQPDLPELTERLDTHITIETNATVYEDIDADLISMSPKLSNSTPEGDWREKHEQDRLNYEVIEQFMDEYPYQLKFVVADRDDVKEITEVLSSLSDYDRDRVMLMPEGVDPDTLQERGEWVAEVCRDKGFRFSPRLQIHLYGNQRAT